MGKMIYLVVLVGMVLWAGRAEAGSTICYTLSNGTIMCFNNDPVVIGKPPVYRAPVDPWPGIPAYQPPPPVKRWRYHPGEWEGDGTWEWEE